MERLEAVLRDYVAALSGVAETNQERARQLVLRLVDVGAAGGEGVAELADDIATTAASTHRRLVSLMRSEAEAAAARVQGERDSELARLSQRLGHLEGQIAALRTRLGDMRLPDAGSAEEADPGGGNATGGDLGGGDPRGADSTEWSGGASPAGFRIGNRDTMDLPAMGEEEEHSRHDHR